MNNLLKFATGIFLTLAVAWLAFVVGARVQFGDLSPISESLGEDNESQRMPIFSQCLSLVWLS